MTEQPAVATVPGPSHLAAWPQLVDAQTALSIRRALALQATPGPWRVDGHADVSTATGSCVFEGYPPGSDARANAQHVAANDPAHVLAVLEQHQGVLRGHRPDPHTAECVTCSPATSWPCAVLRPVLDLYAPPLTEDRP